MSKVSDEFHVAMSLQETEFAVKEAVANCRWGVKAQEPGRIVPRIGVGLTRNPSKIEVLVSANGDKESLVTLSGKIVGMGRFRSAIWSPKSASSGTQSTWRFIERPCR